MFAMPYQLATNFELITYSVWLCRKLHVFPMTLGYFSPDAIHPPSQIYLDIWYGDYILWKSPREFFQAEKMYTYKWILWFQERNKKGRCSGHPSFVRFPLIFKPQGKWSTHTCIESVAFICTIDHGNFQPSRKSLNHHLRLFLVRLMAIDSLS